MTGIELKAGKMYHHGQKVKSYYVRETLISFIDYLPRRSVLVGHNMHQKDARWLIYQLEKEGLMAEFERKVCGFLDTFHLAKELYPERKDNGGFGQVALVQDLLGVEYSAHNAVDDAEHLMQLLRHMKSPTNSNVIRKHTMNFQCAIDRYNHNELTWENYDTLLPLVDRNLLERNMAKRAASSGLGIEHLRMAAKSPQGIKNLFSKPGAMKRMPRVTNSKNICQRVQKYFDEEE